MPTMELVVTEPRDVYKAMLDLIESTHWGTDALACPVYGRKKVRIRDDRYPKSERNASGFRYITTIDTDKPPIKHTYCLVGLLLRVVFSEDKHRVEGEETGPDHEVREHHLVRNVPTSEALLIGLWSQIPDEFWDPAFEDPRPKNPSQTDMVTQLENWNDGSEKQDVVDLIRRAYDASR